MPQFVLPELNAMQKIATIVAELTPNERRRVSVWLSELTAQDDMPQNTVVPDDIFPSKTAGDDDIEAERAPQNDLDSADAAIDQAAEESKSYNTFAELYVAATPRKGAQKAAVAGYWLETIERQDSWTAYEVNKLLKSIDVKVSSMSIVLTNAVKVADPYIVELERLGNSERSRKTFRLSETGTAYVEGLLA